MANSKKRFTEIYKWDDPWFRKLPVNLKVFWFYILDRCDDAGVWEVDMDRVAFDTGMVTTKEELLGGFIGRIEKISEKHWFVTKFISFQYKQLRQDLRVHTQAYNSLVKHGLISRIFKENKELFKSDVKG